MSNATRALGTKLKMEETEIGNLTSINGIEITADTIDKTTLDSDGGYKEFLGGFKDAGEVQAEGFFDPTSQIQISLQDVLDSGVEKDFSITFPTLPKVAMWNFKGVVTGYTVGNAEVEGLLSFGVTIKVSGRPVMKIAE